MLERLVVKQHRIFARRRFDKGISKQFKVEIFHNHERSLYAQNLPASTNLKDKFSVKLILQRDYGVITPLSFSKRSLPIFAQHNPKGKLRFFGDPRQIIHLTKHAYEEHNHQLTSFADAVQRMALKSTFVNLTVLKAYHCVQMTNEQSIQQFNYCHSVPQTFSGSDQVTCSVQKICSRKFFHCSENWQRCPINWGLRHSSRHWRLFSPNYRIGVSTYWICRSITIWKNIRLIWKILCFWVIHLE